MADAPVAKDAARRGGRAARAALGPARRAALARRICARVAALPQIAKASRLALFWPRGDEVDIRHLFAKWASAGRSLFLPTVVAAGTKLQMHSMLPGELVLRTGYGGISEPSPAKPSFAPARIDLILVPASSVDRRGNRVGSGRGFYDITLKTMPSPLVICPLFSCQLSAPIEPEEHDVPVDLIVTEEGVIDAGARRARSR